MSAVPHAGCAFLECPVCGTDAVPQDTIGCLACGDVEDAICVFWAMYDRFMCGAEPRLYSVAP